MKNSLGLRCLASALTLGLIALSGCSGHGDSTSGMLPSDNLQMSNAPVAPPPSALTKAFVKSLPHVSLPGLPPGLHVIPPAMPRDARVLQSGRVRALSSVGANDAEVRGGLG